jgi:hypothetical protein
MYLLASYSYVKYIEGGHVAPDTQLVGTVIYKTLKVSKWQASALHGQAGDQGSRVSSQYH